MGLGLMVEFCPECGNMLRKKPCGCGSVDQPSTSKDVSSNSLIEIWNPPSPNTIYCRITGTAYDKLKKILSKGAYPEELKEIRKKINRHLYSCCNCVYYVEKVFHCKFKNKFLNKTSICKSFEPWEI